MISFTSLGGEDDGGYYDDILEYKPSTGEWSLVDQMMSARYYHAVSVMSAEITKYC